MIGNTKRNNSVLFSKILQNPSQHVTDSCKLKMKGFNIDKSNEIQWIEFEDKFSVANFSGLEGLALKEFVNILSVMNTQGGLASNYMNEIKMVPRSEVMRAYYKYVPLRDLSYSSNTFDLVSNWLFQNEYISELEINRLLSYSLERVQEISPMSDFNRVLIQEEIASYVEEYWS